MNEDRFDALLRDAAETFRTPPAADLDGMWTEIERRSAPTLGQSSRGVMSQRHTWLTVAATLAIGIALGRASSVIGHRPTPRSAVALVGPAGAARDSASGTASLASNSYGAETSNLLDQTAALLISLPTQVNSVRANEQFVGRAGDLLTTTRLLLDSPAANDASMRGLLEDLELVLTQVVRLQNNHSRTELDLINRALEQRDVIPRLRTAAGDYSAN